MARNSASNIHESVNDDGWKTVVEPYGDTWDFDKNPVCIGQYLSKREVEQDDMNNPGTMRMANVYELVTPGSSDSRTDEKVSVWGTYILDEAFAKIEVGKFVRIEYTGKVDLKGGREVRKFKVSVK